MDDSIVMTFRPTRNYWERLRRVKTTMSIVKPKNRGWKVERQGSSRRFLAKNRRLAPCRSTRNLKLDDALARLRKRCLS